MRAVLLGYGMCSAAPDCTFGYQKGQPQQWRQAPIWWSPTVTTRDTLQRFAAGSATGLGLGLGRGSGLGSCILPLFGLVRLVFLTCVMYRAVYSHDTPDAAMESLQLCFDCKWSFVIISLHACRLRALYVCMYTLYVFPGQFEERFCSITSGNNTPVGFCEWCPIFVRGKRTGVTEGGWMCGFKLCLCFSVI